MNVTSSATAQHNSPALGAARIIDANSNLQGLFSGANLSGNQQVSNAASSTLPLLTGGTTHAVQSGLTSFNNIIDARQGYNRGASSGDDFQGNHDVWVKAFGTLTNQADTQGVNGYKVKTSGVVLGLDKTVNSKLNLGAAFAYADSNVTSDISGGGTQNMNVKSYQLIGYGSYALNPTDTFNFQVDGGQNNNSGSRHITFLNEVANSSYDSWSAHLGASLSRNYVLSERATMTPSMRVDYTHISESGYSENGAGLLDLNVARNDTEALVLGLDDKLAYKLNDHITLSANLGLGYNAMNKQNSINSAFAGDPTASFVTTGINDGAWLGRGGLGLSYKANNGLEITGRYDVDFHSSYLSQTASVKLNMPF